MKHLLQSWHKSPNFYASLLLAFALAPVGSPVRAESAERNAADLQTAKEQVSHKTFFAPACLLNWSGRESKPQAELTPAQEDAMVFPRKPKPALTPAEEAQRRAEIMKLEEEARELQSRMGATPQILSNPWYHGAPPTSHAVGVMPLSNTENLFPTPARHVIQSGRASGFAPQSFDFLQFTRSLH